MTVAVEGEANNLKMEGENFYVGMILLMIIEV